jgi:hypothetical protein
LVALAGFQDTGENDSGGCAGHRGILGCIEAERGVKSGSVKRKGIEGRGIEVKDKRLEMEYLEREPEREFDLMEYWRVIVKRKGILFTFAGTVILLVGIYSFTASPKYQPTATLLIGEEASKTLNIQDEFGFVNYSSQIKEQIFINTQLQLLKSQAMADRVARNRKTGVRGRRRGEEDFGPEIQGSGHLPVAAVKKGTGGDAGGSG